MYRIAKFMLFILLLSTGCNQKLGLEEYGKHYQTLKDYKSLSKVVEQMEFDIDTGFVKRVLGEPISMGFDYRYLTDSVDANECIVGAVFHINTIGKIDQKWVGAICE